MHLFLCLVVAAVRRVLVDLVVHVFLVGLAVLFHDQVDLVDHVYLVALAVLFHDQVDLVVHLFLLEDLVVLSHDLEALVHLVPYPAVLFHLVLVVRGQVVLVLLGVHVQEVLFHLVLVVHVQEVLVLLVVHVQAVLFHHELVDLFHVQVDLSQVDLLEHLFLLVAVHLFLLAVHGQVVLVLLVVHVQAVLFHHELVDLYLFHVRVDLFHLLFLLVVGPLAALLSVAALLVVLLLVAGPLAALLSVAAPLVVLLSVVDHDLVVRVLCRLCLLDPDWVGLCLYRHLCLCLVLGAHVL